MYCLQDCIGLGQCNFDVDGCMFGGVDYSDGMVIYLCCVGKKVILFGDCVVLWEQVLCQCVLVDLGGSNSLVYEFFLGFGDDVQVFGYGSEGSGFQYWYCFWLGYVQLGLDIYWVFGMVESGDVMVQYFLFGFQFGQCEFCIVDGG